MKNSAFYTLCLVVVFLFSLPDFSYSQHNIEELGRVKWLRIYDEATALSSKSGKPIFILFQEIPGCSTCKNFGQNIMEHPLIVEAIESYFVPLAIYNNKGGADKAILDKFGEPAWNNPVIRIINAKGKDLSERGNGKYDLKSFVPFLRRAIMQTNNVVPQYIQLLEDEVTAEKEEVILQMYCFWTGEKELGMIPGVVNTQAGFSNGSEVVKVEFDKNKTTTDDIVKRGKKSGVADAVVPQNLNKSSFRLDNDLHYYLKNSAYASIPMLKIQATKVNSLIGQKITPDSQLSPKQLAVLAGIKAGKLKNELRYEKDIKEMWKLLL